MKLDDAQSIKQPLVDQYGRTITYLRVSLTDRCNLRCTYCMDEEMKFAPRADILTFEEIITLVRYFVQRGVRHIRFTGGEPLVRKDFSKLITEMAAFIGHGLDEITLTTNGVFLGQYAPLLATLGINRINLSLDSLDRAQFARITGFDKLNQTLASIKTARAYGLQIRINTVAMGGVDGNIDEIPKLVAWAHEQGCKIALIEAMPLGADRQSRRDQFISLATVKNFLARHWQLSRIEKTGQHRGPAEYYSTTQTGGEIGFITPLSNHFCGDCNRVRLTATGVLHACLGHELGVDLRSILRTKSSTNARRASLNAAISSAMNMRPLGHDFLHDLEASKIRKRTMSVTGG